MTLTKAERKRVAGVFVGLNRIFRIRPVAV
jgi:hypothetical protein